MLQYCRNYPRHQLERGLSAGLKERNSPSNTLLCIAKEIEHIDKQSLAVHNQRGALTEERDRLIQYRFEIERLRTQRTAANVELAAAQSNLTQFNDNNRDLLQAIAEEETVIKLNQRIKVAYDGFLPEIQRYMAALRHIASGIG